MYFSNCEKSAFCLWWLLNAESVSLKNRGLCDVWCGTLSTEPCQEYHLHFSLAIPRRKAGEREVACSSQRSFHWSLFERVMKTWASEDVRDVKGCLRKSDATRRGRDCASGGVKWCPILRNSCMGKFVQNAKSWGKAGAGGEMSVWHCKYAVFFPRYVLTCSVCEKE